jgi:hypothetical protein
MGCHYECFHYLTSIRLLPLPSWTQIFYLAPYLRTPPSKDTNILQKSTVRLIILDARRVIYSKVHIDDPKVPVPPGTSDWYTLSVKDQVFHS